MDAILVKNLSKAYKEYISPWDRLREWIGFDKNPRHILHWVLKDINFSISSGEAVGLIGINGAGKSTLLKIIAGTVKPTKGEVQIDGRVSALLELGIGFHPAFTGRQNAQMSSQLGGLSAEEIAQIIPEIQEFSELGEYFDQPVRTYSSGMHVRLAFSVATAIRPDILIVDEALAVGDSYFQHKCSQKIKSFLSAGTTLLFVSHSADAVKSLCTRAIMISGGGVLHDGSPDEVFDHYNALIAARTESYHISEVVGIDGKLSRKSGNGACQIISADLLQNNITSRVITTLEKIEISLEIKISDFVEDLSAGILIRDRWGNDVWGTNTFHQRMQFPDEGIGNAYIVKFAIPKFCIAPGSYSISAALHSGRDHISGNYDWIDRILTFDVLLGSNSYCVGVCNLPVEVEILSISRNSNA